MNSILITNIEVDFSTIHTPSSPIIVKRNINRLFAKALIDDSEGKHKSTMELDLTPDEVEDFQTLSRKIAARIKIEAKSHSG